MFTYPIHSACTQKHGDFDIMRIERKLAAFSPREPNRREENFDFFLFWFREWSCFTDFRYAEFYNKVTHNKEASNSEHNEHGIQ